MDPFASYAPVENPQQFWAELDDILDTPFHPPTSSSSSNESEEEALLNAKRIYVASITAKFLHLCAACFNDHLTSEYNQDHCINRLFSSTAFRDDADATAEEGSAASIPMHQLAAEEAIRIMQTSTSIPILLMTYEMVLQYGDAFPSAYKSIQASATTVSWVGVRAFLHRLVHQVWAGSYAAQAEAKIGISNAPTGWNGKHWDEEPDPIASSSTPASTTATYVSKGLTSSSASKDIAIQISLREKAVRMLYEVCRVQKLEPAHLKAFDERFIHHLFDLVEETRHHHDEDFNYRLIKLLVAMNEQYMVVTLTSSAPASSAAGNQINSAPPTTSRPANLVLSVLQQRLNASKTFGENLIFMLNRASSSDAEDVCMQLLVLKLLYLLFTTKETACYFYTNDLRVLVDIFIRELNDLPDESESLRHTYLRVLHPLLTNTQLCTYPYKRPQIRRLLTGLLAHGHLNDISSTTKRLVERCLRAEWCVELDRLDGTERVVKVEPIGGGETHEKRMEAGVTSEGLPMLATKIKENSASVQHTAESLAATTQEEVMEEDGTDSNEITSPTAVGAEHKLNPSHSSGSLSVPATLRTRDKRVASLSHPRTAASSLADDGNTLLRPTSAASLSSATGKNVRRAVSAQSAPCTPPRAGSPSPNPTSAFTSTSRQDSVQLSSPVEMDDALSTSSSWHAHMTEDPPLHSRSQDAPATAVEGAGAVPLSIGPHLYQSVVGDNIAASSSPRVGSPLSCDSTMQVLDATALQQQQQHHQEGSDSTIHAAPMSAGSSSSVFEPKQRRKPPQPPMSTQARRAMQLSSSAPHFGSDAGSASGSRAGSPSWASTGSSPVTEDGGQIGGGGSAISTAGKTGSVGRRRPPPPPPSTATPPPSHTLSNANLGNAGHVEADGEGDDLASAQSWYIAERLRRGLRIK